MVYIAESPGPLSRRFTEKKEMSHLPPLEDDVLISDHVSPSSKPPSEPTSPVSSPTSEKSSPFDQYSDPDPVYYTDVKIGKTFRAMQKVHDMYFVPFECPVVVQTPVVRLVDSTKKSAILKISNKFSTFVQEFENTILTAAQTHTEWFKKIPVEDDAIKNGFKSFLNNDCLTVKLDEDFAAFDSSGNFMNDEIVAPVNVRCILEVSGICFGSVEFGALFTLRQAQIVQIPKCVIQTPKDTCSYFE
jgi:hypothetical protein